MWPEAQRRTSSPATASGSAASSETSEGRASASTSRPTSQPTVTRYLDGMEGALARPGQGRDHGVLNLRRADLAHDPGVALAAPAVARRAAGRPAQDDVRGGE